MSDANMRVTAAIWEAEHNPTPEAWDRVADAERVLAVDGATEAERRIAARGVERAEQRAADLRAVDVDPETMEAFMADAEPALLALETSRRRRNALRALLTLAAIAVLALGLAMGLGCCSHEALIADMRERARDMESTDLRAAPAPELRAYIQGDVPALVRAWADELEGVAPIVSARWPPSSRSSRPSTTPR